jgi:hypothetical protein
VLGRVVGTRNGHIIEAVGWPGFFVITMLVAVPGLLLIVFGGLDRAVARPPETAPPPSPQPAAAVPPPGDAPPPAR